MGLHHSFDLKELGTYAIKEKAKRYRDDVQKEIDFLEGKDANSGEIERLEKQKKANKKNTRLGKTENEIRTLSILNIKYSSLQRCIDFKQTMTNNDFEHFFIRDLNLNTESAIQLEANSLDNTTSATNVSLEEIDRRLNQAKENLEKLKVEKKNADEARVLTRSQSQSQTDENYMDYYQDASGNTNRDFERKSYYQWQWHDMQKKGKQYFEGVK